MPTYGYECKSCGHGFEAVQKITDDALDTCEQCGGVLKKKIFPVGIVFKGSGFYVNDYAKKTESANDAAATTTSTDVKTPETAKSTNSETDTKPAEAPSKETKTEATSPPPTTPAATTAAK